MRPPLDSLVSWSYRGGQSTSTAFLGSPELGSVLRKQLMAMSNVGQKVPIDKRSYAMFDRGEHKVPSQITSGRHLGQM